jgi:hypothetical protein
MIESGLSNWALANAAIQALLGRSHVDVAAKTYSSAYFSFLPKKPVLPALLIDRIQAKEATDTLDARTSAATMLEGRFQFGCVANDNARNPVNASGYLSARELSRTVREQLLGLDTGTAVLPDGTVINDLWIVDEFDAHFEVGGLGYLYRRVLQVGMLFTETDAIYVAREPELFKGFGPPITLEMNDDVYFDQGTGNLYEQSLGVWVLIGNIPQGGDTEMPSLTYHAVAQAGNNAFVIKSAAGIVTGWKIYNNADYPIFVKLYNLPTLPLPALDEPQQTIGVDAGLGEPSNSAGGYSFSAGIGIAIVKGIADDDDTSVDPNDCVVDIFYQ